MSSRTTKTTDNAFDVFVETFAKQIIPSSYESRPTASDVMVKHGLDNLYPKYLLDIYQKCPIHHSIINTKTTFIIGDGLKLKGGGEIPFKPNATESMDEFIDKVVKDFLIFNSFGIEVQYNKLTYKEKPLAFNHIPAHSLRTNNNKSIFWFRPDWLYTAGEIQYDVWSDVNTDYSSKVFWYDGYIPSQNRVYVEPDYIACLDSIAIDMLIRQFNKNNISSNFSPSKVVTYYVGESVPNARKEEMRRDTMKFFTGAGGERILFNFANPGKDNLKIEDLDSNSWDRAYELTRETVRNEIYQGHSISDTLVGTSTPGKLGGTQELEMHYEIFKTNYILNKRNQIQAALSTLFGVEVEFIDKPLFKNRIAEATKEKIYTINELRELEGLKPIADGDRLLTTTNTNQVQPPAQSLRFTNQERRLSVEDFEKVKDMGIFKSEFDFICEGGEEKLSQVELKFDDVTDISKYVLENDIKGLSISQLKALIRKDLGIELPVSEFRKILNDLSKSGVIVVNEVDGKIDIKPPVEPQVPPSRSVTVMYEYEVKPGLGERLIKNSRDFCVKLIENDRYYTRAEIQQMSSIFGYDVYTYTGGYYHNPETNITTPSCRHYFKPVIVTPKSK